MYLHFHRYSWLKVPFLLCHDCPCMGRGSCIGSLPRVLSQHLLARARRARGIPTSLDLHRLHPARDQASGCIVAAVGKLDFAAG